MLDLADGAAAPAIKSAAEATNADTIVMGTRGLRQIEAVTFGSVSQEVCRTVQCTCVAVH
jgi:nucleotide-binding universal stress UspA family protein